MRRWQIWLAPALVLVSCNAPGPCFDVDGTCVALTLHGDGTVESAAATVNGRSNSVSNGREVPLPATVIIEPNIGVDLGNPVRLDIALSLTGHFVAPEMTYDEAGATTQLMVVPTSYREVALTVCPGPRPQCPASAGSTGSQCTDGQWVLPSGFLLCSGQCVDGNTDIKNCGACGQTCATGASCVAGMCQCPDGGEACGGTCRDVATDLMNCGGCGQVCACGGSSCINGSGAAACVAGACQVPCNPGFGDCDHDATNGCEVPLDDVANCGACGRACQAGEQCVGGACAVVLADEGSEINSLYQDATNLYWLNGASVRTIAKSGGGSAATLVNASFGPQAMYLHGSTIFLYNGTTIYSVPTSGGTPKLLGTITGSDPIAALAANATNLYVTTATECSNGTPIDRGSLLRFPVAGGSATSLLTTGILGQLVATDAGDVYFGRQGSFSGSFCAQYHSDGAISLGVDSPPTFGAQSIATAQYYPGGLALDAANVYWVDAAGGIWSEPLGGGTPSALLPGGARNGGLPRNHIALQGGFVYATTATSLVKVPIAGGSPETLFGGGNLSFVVDASHVYLISGLQEVVAIPN